MEPTLLEPPHWPAWFAPAGFVGAFLVVVVIVGALGAAVGVDTTDVPPEFTLLGTLIQDAVLVLVALGLARTVARPRIWHFGLRRVAFRSAVGWSFVALVSFYVFAAIYAVAVQPSGEQTIVEDLGADESTALLVATAVVVVVIAPFVEEVFFRGFLYGALRGRFGVAAATMMNGILFGAVHYSGPDTLPLMPPLALLGALFCLLYERTGSLYPVIAVHAVNNTVALAVQTGPDGAVAAGAAGLFTLGACVALPRRQRGGTPLLLTRRSREATA